MRFTFNLKKLNFRFVLSFVFYFCWNPIYASTLSTDLVDEVIAQSKTRRLYDWRNEKLGIEYKLFTVNERNSFDSEGYEFALSKTFERRYLGLIGLRSIQTLNTSSTEMISMTPFTQAAQPSRKEFFVNFGIPLLAGRSFTFLSPHFPDLEHVLYFKFGGHINFFENKFNLTETTKITLPGQRLITYRYVFDLGLRLQFSIPYSLSLFFDYDYFNPGKQSDPDLKEWSLVGGGLAWSF